MSSCNRLLALVNEELMPEVEEYIDLLFGLVNSQKADADDKASLEEARELLKSYKEMEEDLKNGNEDEDECKDILREIESMRKEEE